MCIDCRTLVAKTFHAREILYRQIDVEIAEMNNCLHRIHTYNLHPQQRLKWWDISELIGDYEHAVEEYLEAQAREKKCTAETTSWPTVTEI